MSIVFNKSKEISLDDETLRSDLLKIASGMDNVIALGRGDPDFHTPRHIVEAAKKALDENKHHYTLQLDYQNWESQFLRILNKNII